MSVLLDPLGFVADSIAIANALGFYTSAQQEQTNRLLKELSDVSHQVQVLNEQSVAQCEQITCKITTAAVVEVRSRLQNITAIPSQQLELLIRLLFSIKECANNVIFAIIVKYRYGRTAATLGFAGSSSDAIEELVKKVNMFCRSISAVKQDMTAYVTVRIRGKYTSQLENICSATLTAIATEVCNLSSKVELANVRECQLQPLGTKTVVLLQPGQHEEERGEYDRLRRVFLVGDTRSGKSSLGNALLQQELFAVSKGMTGTMQIARGESAENINDELWVTEIYDTPGLNDKDGLDVLYQAAIEDHITILQRASALVMTVSVDAGMTQSAFKSVAAYKTLFGDSIGSMLIVVLTVNETADAEELRDHLELNWPTVSGIDNRIMKKNVFCVSLFDLRGRTRSASHGVVNDIRLTCRAMPMKVIEAIEERFRQLQESMLKGSADVEKEVESIMNDGWQRYEYLSEQYEASAYAKLTGGCNSSGFVDGFVMKRTSTGKKVLAWTSLGMINTIRKDAIHIRPQGKTAERAWHKFVEKYGCGDLHRCDLMWLFGNLLDDWGLGVIVSDRRTTFVGTLRVKRYDVRVFDPVNRTHEELRHLLQTYLSQFQQEQEEELRPELIADMMRPITQRLARCAKTRRNKVSKRSTELSRDVAHSFDTVIDAP